MTQKRQVTFNVDDKFNQLFSQLSQTKPYLPQFLTKQVLNTVGFSSQDNQTYKLVSCMVDYTLEQIVNSIKNTKVNKKKKDQEGILYEKDVASQLQEFQRPQVYPILDLKRQN